MRSKYPYIWAWGRSSWCVGEYPLAKYKGEYCRVLVRGKRNSALIEFEMDGHRVVASRNGLRKRKK